MAALDGCSDGSGLSEVELHMEDNTQDVHGALGNTQMGNILGDRRSVISCDPYIPCAAIH